MVGESDSQFLQCNTIVLNYTPQHKLLGAVTPINVLLIVKHRRRTYTAVGRL